jgi:hypothetical protein
LSLLTDRLSIAHFPNGLVNMSSFTNVSVSQEHSTISDSVGPPTDNSRLTTATAVPLLKVRFLQERLAHDEFTFIVSHKSFQTSVVETMLLSPAVCEQFQVDACARRCVIDDPEIPSFDFSSLQELHRKLLILLSGQLCNVGLERLFFGLWSHYNVNSAVIF